MNNTTANLAGGQQHERDEEQNLLDLPTKFVRPPSWEWLTGKKMAVVRETWKCPFKDNSELLEEAEVLGAIYGKVDDGTGRFYVDLMTINGKPYYTVICIPFGPDDAWRLVVQNFPPAEYDYIPSDKITSMGYMSYIRSTGERMPPDVNNWCFGCEEKMGIHAGKVVCSNNRCMINSLWIPSQSNENFAALDSMVQFYRLADDTVYGLDGKHTYGIILESEDDEWHPMNKAQEDQRNHLPKFSVVKERIDALSHVKLVLSSYYQSNPRSPKIQMHFKHRMLQLVPYKYHHGLYGLALQKGMQNPLLKRGGLVTAQENVENISIKVNEEDSDDTVPLFHPEIESIPVNFSTLSNAFAPLV